MASSLLSSIGLSSSLDPTKYENQKQLNEQTAEVKSNIGTTLDAINVILQAGSLFGAPSDATQQLLLLQTQAKSLLESNLAPDELERKRKELQDKFDRLEAGVRRDQAAAKLQSLQDVRAKIRDRADAVLSDTTTSSALAQKYIDLQNLADSSIKAQQDVIKGYAVPSGATGPSGPSGSVPYVVDPEDLQAQLDALDLQKSAEESKSFSFSRFSKQTWGVLRNVLYYSIIGIGALFGGIILSNAYCDEAFIGVRAWYFFYGAVFFPFVILYAIYSPPYLRAILFPAVPMKGEVSFNFMNYQNDLDEAGLEAAFGSTKGVVRWTSVLYTVSAAVFFGFYFGYKRLIDSVRVVTF